MGWWDQSLGQQGQGRGDRTGSKVCDERLHRSSTVQGERLLKGQGEGVEREEGMEWDGVSYVQHGVERRGKDEGLGL